MEFTLSESLEYMSRDAIKTWLEAYLEEKGIEVEYRNFKGPCRMLLSDIDEKIEIIEEVEESVNRFRDGWDMPPLIVKEVDKKTRLIDDKLRFSILKEVHAEDYWVIILE